MSKQKTTPTLDQMAQQLPTPPATSPAPAPDAPAAPIVTAAAEAKTHPAAWRTANRAAIEAARGDADAMKALDAAMIAAAAGLPASVREVTKDGTTHLRTAGETGPGEQFDTGRTYITFTLTDDLRAAIYKVVQGQLAEGKNTTLGLWSRDIIAKDLGVTIDTSHNTPSESVQDRAAKIAGLKAQYAYELANPEWFNTPEGRAARAAAFTDGIAAAKKKAEDKAAKKAQKEVPATAPAAA